LGKKKLTVDWAWLMVCNELVNWKNIGRGVPLMSLWSLVQNTVKKITVLQHKKFLKVLIQIM
jgi:hypothetical protein